MGQRTLDGDDISELRAAYRRRITEELPRAARRADWHIQEDHCFARVVLDNVFGDAWYDHVNGRPVYEHLSPAELTVAVDLADRMLEAGRPAVEALNRNSLRWRGELE